MRKTEKIIIGSILMLLLLSLSAVAQEMAAKADEVANDYVKQGKFSGAVLLAKGGKVILSKGYGMANYELDAPNTPQTKYRLGSITKQFTAMAIAQLAERGQISFDAPISKYLADYPKEIGDKVTIHHLLTHTSGIPSFTNSADYQQIKMNKFSGEKLIAWLKDKPLEFTPGENYKYSNSSYFLLGYIIEKVSGKPYDQFLKENIFDPLGMKDSGYDHSEVVLKNRAAGYSFDGKSFTNAGYLDMTVPGGAGALYSTVEDLYFWDRALYTEKLIKRATLDKIFTPFKSNYAYGWVVRDLFGHKRVTHGGGIDGFNTTIARYVDDELCIIVLSNIALSNTTTAVEEIAEKLAAIAFGEKYETPKKTDPISKR